MILLKPTRQTQPPGGTPLADKTHALAFFHAPDGTRELVSGSRLTVASATGFAPSVSLAGHGIAHTAVSRNLYMPVRAGSLESRGQYTAIWHGVPIGAPIGSTPSFVGVANSTTSQSQGPIVIEYGSTSQLQVVFRSLTTNTLRTGSFTWANVYGRKTTMVAFVDYGLGLVTLDVWAEGLGTTRVIDTTLASPAPPTLLGTEQFIVGSDVIEGPTRHLNAVTVLAGVMFSPPPVGLAANPWQLFQPRKIWVPVSVAGGGPSLSLSASSLSVSGTLSTTGDLTITPAVTLALSASPLAIAGTLATAGELDYQLPTLALSASPLALSGTLTPSGDIDYTLPFALTASALAVSGTVSVTGDLSITDEIKLTLSASPLALAGALAVAGDLDYVVPTLVLSASPLALSGGVSVTGDPRGVVPFVLSAGTVAMSGAVSVDGDLEFSDRPIGGLDIEFELEPALWWQRKPKTLGNVKAKAKLAKVAKVIAKKAVEQVEKSAPEAQRKAEVRQAVAPMLPEMPGFDWKPVYEQAYSMALTAAIDAQMRKAEANQAAAREIERIRQLDEEDIAILVAMM